MNILITGSRDAKCVDFIFDKLNKCVDKTKDIIIHGGASGVDSITELWCKENNIKSIIIRPIFLSKPVYYLYRNTEMIGMCDKCIAFWDGKSRGTKFTQDYVIRRNKPIESFII